MIKGVNSNGRWIEVMGGSVSSIPYVSTGTTNPIEGMLRINGSDLQVYASGMWMNIGSGYATVNLTSQAESIMQWAADKMREEKERERKAKDNPALQNALDAIRRAEANFDLLDKIANSDQGELSVVSN